jgi:hypothetical protein
MSPMNADTNVVATSNATCRKCAAPLEEANRVRLWDGLDYCRGCVDRAWPTLADWAIAHSRLEESMPEQVNRELPTFWKAAGIFFPIKLVLLTCFGFWSVRLWATDADQGVWPLIAGIILLLYPVQMIAIRWFFGRPFLRHRDGLPGVVVENGRVKLIRGSAVDREFDLSRCGWYAPRRRMPNHPAGPESPLADKAIMVRDMTASGFNMKGISFCGFTDEMREIWTAFFSLAGAPKQLS